MTEVAALEPREFFSRFAEISAIPRGSYHEAAISAHLVAFARERGLSVTADEIGNLLIKKPATPGYENAAPLVFHGHMDMVLAKDDGVDHDMLTEGVRLRIDGDWIHGTGTTLGADNGVGVAFMMAILDSTTMRHPRLEAIITVQEEVGKAGALALNPSDVEGRRLIDFNWHDPESIFAGCAGDISAWLTIPLQQVDVAEGVLVSIRVHGLEGGHSEFDINHQRANAIQQLGRLLETVTSVPDVRLVESVAGVNRYVIPNDARADVVVPSVSTRHVLDGLRTLGDTIAKEFALSDPNLSVDVTATELQTIVKAATAESTRRVALALRLLPYGVQSMSLDRQDLVESSNTVTNLEIVNGTFRALSTVPSAVTSRKYEILGRIRAVAELLGDGADVSTFADCPEWTYLPDSKLLATAKQAFEAVQGAEPGVEVSHSSLELGLIASKLPGMEMISVGPEAHDLHTTRERLNHTTVQPVWDAVVELLARLND